MIENERRGKQQLLSPSFIYLSLDKRFVLLDLDAMFYRSKNERELIVAVRNLIFRECDSSPAIYTAQSHLHLIETKVCQVSFLYFGRVSLILPGTVIQRLDRIM